MKGQDAYIKKETRTKKHLHIIYGIDSIRDVKNNLESLFCEISESNNEPPKKVLEEPSEPSLSRVLNTAGDELLELSSEIQNFIRCIRIELFDK